MKTRPIAALAAVSILFSGGAIAGPEKFERRGFITNAAGEKCQYQQNILRNDVHFYGESISTTNGEIIFDDPQCMRASEDGPDGDKALINQLIATWYSHPDADFDPANLYKTSLHQVVGQCMRSKRFAAIGVMVDYIMADQSIAKVIHGPSLEGCLN